MRATFRGALAALALIAVGGCTEQGVQTPTEAPTASVSAEVQEVLDVINSSTGERLRGAVSLFREEGCSRSLETPGCILATNELAKESQQMQSELKQLLPVPAEIDGKVYKTFEGLIFVHEWAKLDSDPDHLRQAVDMLDRALRAWSTEGV